MLKWETTLSKCMMHKEYSFVYLEKFVEICVKIFQYPFYFHIVEDASFWVGIF